MSDLAGVTLILAVKMFFTLIGIGFILLIGGLSFDMATNLKRKEGVRVANIGASILVVALIIGVGVLLAIVWRI